MDTIIGQTIDNYKIIDVLGRGGMGVVFKALDTNLEKYVALKMIDPFLAKDESFLKRFKTEARALAKLEDRNIVNVYALRENEYGLFMVMEYVPAKTISEKLRSGTRFSVEEAINITRQLLHAIGLAHNSGIIHRDIKPNNILLCDDGTVKVMDFGLAKVIQEQAGDSTVSNVTAGTLQYMSPEQIRGLKNVDKKSDIYSIGMTVYEIITGRTPFEKTSSQFDVQKQIVDGKILPPVKFRPDIPRKIQQFIMKALEKDPDKRFQDISEMQSALSIIENEAAGHGEKKNGASKNNDLRVNENTRVVNEAAPLSVKRNDRTAERRQKIVYLVIILALIITAGLFYFIINGDNGQEFKITADKNTAKADAPETSQPSGKNQSKVEEQSQLERQPQVEKQSSGTNKSSFGNKSSESKPNSSVTDISVNETGSRRSSAGTKVKNNITPEDNPDSRHSKGNVPSAANSVLMMKTDMPGKIKFGDRTLAENSMEYRATGLKPGKYKVSFENAYHGPVTKNVTLGENDEQNITCYFRQKVTIQAKVIDENGKEKRGFGEIYINGRMIGETTPCETFLKPGKNVIAVRGIDYKTDKDAVVYVTPSFQRLPDTAIVFILKK